MNDGYIGVPGDRVWYKITGDGDGTPLLCLHGGPGSAHYCPEPLEAPGRHRRVIFYDRLGCGNSDRPDNPATWTVSRFVEEFAQVRADSGSSYKQAER